MEDERSQQTLWILIRILCTTFLLFLLEFMFPNMNPYILTMIDLIVVWALEPIDSTPMQLIYGFDWAKTLEYKIQDKMGDMSLYLIVLLLHIKRVGKIGTFEIIFGSLYLFRLVGVILFFLTKDDTWLFVFPNFFMDNVILYIFLTYVLKCSYSTVFILILISIPLKYLAEYLHHMVITKRK